MAKCTIVIEDNPDMSGLDIKTECEPPLKKEGMAPRGATPAQLVFFEFLKIVMEDGARITGEYDEDEE